MTRSLPRLAVIIPSWNSRDLLSRCLESVKAEGEGIEILVVDNGSTDGSVELLSRQGVPHVALPQNVGFAAAVNLGVAKTTARAVLVLNVDTVLEQNCLRTLLDALEVDPGIGGVQPCILQLEGRNDPTRRHAAPAGGAPRVYSAGQALTRDGRAFELGMAELMRPDRATTPREIFGVCGAACLLRRELFTELGGYDERYFAFYEDVDLNVRARIAGWRFEYVPEAVVWHIGNASWQQGFERPAAENARLVARNRLATQIKFMPVSALPRIAAVEAGSLIRAARQRRLLATVLGKFSVLRWLPSLMRERHALRSRGDVRKARRWLARSAAADKLS